MPYILQSVAVCDRNPPKDVYIAIDLGPMDSGGLIDCREAGYSDEDISLECHLTKFRTPRTPS